MCGAGRAAPTAVLGAQSAREVRVGGVVGSGCRPRLAPALPAAPRLPPVKSAPRTTTRPLERAVDAHTAGRGALSVDASASLLGWGQMPRRGGAAEYGSMPQRVATDEMRLLLDGEAPRMFRLAGEVQAIRVTAWLLAVEWDASIHYLRFGLPGCGGRHSPTNPSLFRHLEAGKVRTSCVTWPPGRRGISK